MADHHGPDRAPVSRILATNIQRFRTARGWTYADLETRTVRAGHRIPASTIYQLTHDPRRQISVDVLVAIAAAIGVSPEQLLHTPECALCLDLPPAGFTCTQCNATTPIPTDTGGGEGGAGRE